MSINNSNNYNKYYYNPNLYYLFVHRLRLTAFQAGQIWKKSVSRSVWMFQWPVHPVYFDIKKHNLFNPDTKMYLMYDSIYVSIERGQINVECSMSAWW